MKEEFEQSNRYIKTLRKRTGLREKSISNDELVKMWSGSFTEASVLLGIAIDDLKSIMGKELKSILQKLGLLTKQA